MGRTSLAKRKIDSEEKTEDVDNNIENIDAKKLKVNTPKAKSKLVNDNNETKKTEKKEKGIQKGKSPLAPVQNLKQTKLSFFKQQKDDGNWNIKDFLYDKEWKNLLEDEFEQDYFKTIEDTIKPGYEKDIVRPPKELVFNALNSTKINEIKVVIIGQDPYHDDNQAHGLAFSVPKGIKIPPSLRNIFIELKNDIPSFEKNESLGGCLQKWTKEGVFLLNAFLTVEAHKAGSHAKIGWDKFTDKVISLISEKNDGCAFLLWGAFAQKKELLIDTERHKILKCAHPSPFSVTKFFNSKCFSGANDFLKSKNKEEINWSFV